MISVSLPFLTHSMKTVTVTTSQVGVSMKETMHNKEWEEEDTVCAGFTRSSSYSSKTRDALPPSERTACFSNCDFNMVKEMKHKGRIRSWGFLRFKNNFKNAHFQLCKWPKLLISQATNLIHTQQYISWKVLQLNLLKKQPSTNIILCLDLVFIYFIHLCFIPVQHYGSITQRHSTLACICGVSE